MLHKLLTPISPRWDITLLHFRKTGQRAATALLGLRLPAGEKAAFGEAVKSLDSEVGGEGATPPRGRARLCDERGSAWPQTPRCGQVCCSELADVARALGRGSLRAVARAYAVRLIPPAPPPRPPRPSHPLLGAPLPPPTRSSISGS